MTRNIDWEKTGGEAAGMLKVYGFIPVRAGPAGDVSVFRRAHGVNERLTVPDLAFAIRVLYEMMVRFCA